MFYCCGVDRELLLYFSLQKSRSSTQDLPVIPSHMKHEDIIYDAYMHELNAAMLYVVIFVPGQFSLHSVLLTPVLVRRSART